MISELVDGSAWIWPPVDGWFALLTGEVAAVLGPPPTTIERWIGVYPSGPEDAFFEAPMPGVRLVSVTSGTGASTAFGLAEEVLADLMGMEFPA